jgi:hypothetical protein
VELGVFGGWSVWNWLCLVGGQCGTNCVWSVVSVELAVLWVVSVELAVFEGSVLEIFRWLLCLCAHHCTTEYRR